MYERLLLSYTREEGAFICGGGGTSLLGGGSLSLTCIA